MMAAEPPIYETEAGSLFDCCNRHLQSVRRMGSGNGMDTTAWPDEPFFGASSKKIQNLFLCSTNGRFCSIVEAREIQIKNT